MHSAQFSWPLLSVNRCANPAYTPDELSHQLTTAKAHVLIVHPVCLESALLAARSVNLAADHIVLMDTPDTKSSIPFPTVSDLVNEGLSNYASFTERHLTPGEAKTKLAFLSFSSGTTGKPKVSNITRNLPSQPAIYSFNYTGCSYPTLCNHSECNSALRTPQDQRGLCACRRTPFPAR